LAEDRDQYRGIQARTEEPTASSGATAGLAILDQEGEDMRKKLASLLAIAVLAAAACTSSNATPAPGTAGPSTNATPVPATPVPATPVPATAAPKNGGTLVVALDGDMAYADPSLVSDGNSIYVTNQVVEGLVGLKPGTISDIVPVLATALPAVSTDGLTYTFKLRTGVKFHDGTDFNADAVKKNYERWKAFPTGDLQDNAYYYGAVFGGFGSDSNLTSIDTPDVTTVVFHFKTPVSNFLIAQTLSVFGILSPSSWAAGDANNPSLEKNPYAQGQGKSMVGTGPFMFSDWTRNDHITLVKNPNYWDTNNAPHLDKIVFKPFKDATAKLQALQAGDVDLVQSLAPNDVTTVKGNSNLQVLDRGSSCDIAQISMNNAKAPLDNKNIRFAIAAAVNKQSYINTFYAGEADLADNWMPAAAQYYKPENLPTYDPTKARSYITQSGLTGSALTIDLWYPSGGTRPYMPDPKGLAQAIANDLEAVGFTINLKTEQLSPNYFSDEEVGKFQMWILGWTCDWAGADNFLDTAFFHYTGGKPSPEFNYKNDLLNTTMNSALSATDAATIQADWEKAQDLVAADMPTVPLLSAKPPAGAKKTVMGFVGAGNMTEIFNSVWLNS
jgi:peptide/nickel transport system substrate-binding protein